MSTKKGTRFVKPSPAEVEAYAKTIQFPINGEEFCDFYESKGWVVGRSPMKCWKAAVRTWKRGFVKRGGVLLESKDEIKSIEPTAQQVKDFFGKGD